MIVARATSNGYDFFNGVRLDELLYGFVHHCHVMAVHVFVLLEYTGFPRVLPETLLCLLKCTLSFRCFGVVSSMGRVWMNCFTALFTIVTCWPSMFLYYWSTLGFLVFCQNPCFVSSSVHFPLVALVFFFNGTRLDELLYDFVHHCDVMVVHVFVLLEYTEFPCVLPKPLLCLLQCTLSSRCFDV